MRATLGHDVDASAAVTAAGSTLGPFRVIDVLGKGGMSAVYAAYEEHLDREVALKVLAPELLHDEAFAKRFRQEARVVAGLEHPNIVPIYSSGIDGGIAWISMRLLTGGTVGDLLAREGRLSIHRIIQILGDVAAALDYAHERGVVHRDIKPTNILLDHDGRASVGDFGLAHVVQWRQRSMTLGHVAGTPEYMSPEQALGKETDHRSDVYSLGVVAYEMLTGDVPFSSADPLATLWKHVYDRVPVPSRREVSRGLFRPVQIAMAKRPEERWRSATSFVEAFERGLGPSVWLSPRLTRAGWAGAALSLGTIAVVAALRLAPERTGSASSHVGEPATPQIAEPVSVQPALRPQPQTEPVSMARTNGSGPRRPMPVVAPPAPERAFGHAANEKATEERADDRLPAAQTASEHGSVDVAKNENEIKKGEPAREQSSAAANDLAPTATPPGAIATGDIVTPPVRIKTVQPAYPSVALSAGIEGEVVLLAVVGPDGRVTSLEVARSAHPVLDDAAKRAVAQYLYEPALRNGAPVAFTVQIPVVFKLQ